MTDSVTPGGPRYGEGEWSIIRRAVGVQLRVLAALFWREAGMRRSRASTLGWAAAGLEPLIIIVAITTLFTVLERSPAYGTSMLLFVGTGVFPIYLFIHTSLRVREPLVTSQFSRLPVELPLDEVWVHSVLHMVASAGVAVLYFSVLYAIGVRDAMPFDLWGAIAALSAIFLLGVAMGIFNSVVGRLFPIWDTLWPALSRATLHFSGMYFVADYLPPSIRYYFSFNPLSHGVTWFRHAFYPFYPNVLNNHAYVLAAGAVALLIGLCLERVLRQRLYAGNPPA